MQERPADPLPIVVNPPAEPQPRNPEFPNTQPDIALVARLLMGNKAPGNKNALNPAVVDIPAVPVNQPGELVRMSEESKSSTFQLIGVAGTKDSIAASEAITNKTNAQQLTDWKQYMVREGANQANNVHMQKLRQRGIGGLNFNEFNDATVLMMYDRYKGAATKQGEARRSIKSQTTNKKYVVEDTETLHDDIIRAYTTDGRVDRAAIAADMQTFEWLTRTLLSRDAQADLLDRLHGENDIVLEPDTFMNGAFAVAPNADNALRVNHPIQEEIRRLTRLHGASEIQTEVATAYVARANPPATPPTPANPNPNPELRNGNGERDRRRALEQRFNEVQGEALNNGNYFVSWVPRDIPIAVNELQNYETTEPFFVNVTGNGATANTNRNVIPYVFDIGDGNPVQNARNPRFLNAEERTGGDSGLFAISAAANRETQRQEQLYKLLGNKILEIHRNDPQLLQRWLQAQGDQNADNQSIQLFILHDMERARVDGNTNGSLLTYNAQARDNNQRPLIDRNALGALWTQRINTLSGLLTSRTPEMSDNEMRWLEFLSHSVKVSELIGAANIQGLAERALRQGQQGNGPQGGNRGGGNRGGGNRGGNQGNGQRQRRN